jgi:glycosyltransferase involved in cell wall biosynthesis
MARELSVIICTYNNCNLLVDCLNCLAAQELDDEEHFELLVIDNCSTDNTKNVVDDFIVSGKIPNLNYIFEPEPGLTHARLAGITHAKYSWIAFIDDDVRVQKNWVHSALAFIQSHPKAGVISGRIQLQYVEAPSTAALQCEAALCKVDYGIEDLNFQPDGPPIRLAGAAIIFQKQAVVETGWLEKRYLIGRTGKSLSSGEDTEIIIRIKNKGWEIWYTPSLNATHLIPPTRTTVNYLCRLHRGLARTSAQLRAIGMDGKVPIDFQLKNLAADVGFTTRRIIAWLFHDLIKNRSLGDKRLVQIYEGIGRVESCIDFLLNSLERKA